jgi:hypothetical protein
MVKRFIAGLLLGLVWVGCISDPPGCNDPNARNFNPNAVNDDICRYPSPGYLPLCVFFGSSSNESSGSFGFPIFQEVIQQYGATSIPISCFASGNDNLFSGASVGIASALKNQLIPSFSVENASNLINFSEVSSALNQAKKSSPVSADVMIGGFKNDSISVDVFGVFHEEVQGDFYVDVLCLEDNLQSFQAGSTVENFRHRNVLRAAASGSGIGYRIAKGKTPKGFSFALELKIPANGAWVFGNLKFVGIIWKDTGFGLEYVNGRFGS